MSKYRIVVYRRAGVEMQTFNADTLEHALDIQRRHSGVQGVYKIELLITVETWRIEDKPRPNVQQQGR